MSPSIKRIAACLALIAAIGAVARPVLSIDLSPDKIAIEKAVRAMCDKQLVVMGEAYHGDGRTDAVRVALVTRLTDQCGFRAVLFESSAYEFAPVARAARAGQSVTPAMIATAVGGLWKFDDEVKPLFVFLADRINAGTMSVAGLDYQVATFEQPYTNETMAVELAEALPQGEAGRCRSLIGARTGYAYSDDEQPGPIAKQLNQLLLNCVEAATAALEDQPSIAPALRDERRHMLRNLAGVLSADRLPVSARLAARDGAMADNVSAFMARQPQRTKVIIWTHNVHAARDPLWRSEFQASPNLGARIARTFGSSAFMLGITARTGEYRWSRKTNKPVPTPPPGALETLNVSRGAVQSTFLDTKALQRAGEVPGALDNHVYRTVNWSRAFDGVIVLNSENAPHSTRPGY